MTSPAGTPEMVERVCAAIQAAMCDVRSLSWKPDALMVARAAIGSMRDPTEDMIEAGDCVSGIPVDPADVWRAMVDAALSASEPPLAPVLTPEATTTPQTGENAASGQEIDGGGT